MRELHQSFEMLERGLRQHAVAEVEDVPRPAARRLDHPASAILYYWPGPEQKRRIEVALDPPVVANRAPGFPQVNPPIDADDITAGFPQ